ncbi:MAG: hypothetical protein ACFCUR_07020 [Rhodomicrobiaceae bacterium]
MTFEEALAQQPQWVQIWVNVMAVILVGSFITLLFSRATRRDALIILLVNIPNVLLLQWMYAQLGYVRLLGLPHLIFWTPLAVYLAQRLRDPAIVAPFRQVIWLLLAMMLISLAFDYTDVARYLLGERAPLTGPVPA